MPHTTVNPEHAMEARLAQNTCWIMAFSGSVVVAPAVGGAVVVVGASVVVVMTGGIRVVVVVAGGCLVVVGCGAVVAVEQKRAK